jgi:hypothetical protein
MMVHNKERVKKRKGELIIVRKKSGSGFGIGY